MLTARALAKINWSLDVLSLGEDGYHELDMVMQRIALHDTLTFCENRELILTIGGERTAAGKNLILKAAYALQEASGCRKGARIDLTKRIPVRAGLGGGSADCAVTLIALNRFWGLGYDAARLREIGASLGADVPFCMEGRFARVRGIGERIEPLPGARRWPLLLVMPEEGLSTREVFEAWDETGEAGRGHIEGLISALVRGNLDSAAVLSGNALERPATGLLPSIPVWIDRIRGTGARYVRMTGSGSCIFGVYSSREEAQTAAERLGSGIVTETVI